MSSRCPKCGNVIPEWSHGVCYTCVRIEKEYKRYGRRRPATSSPIGKTEPVQRKRVRKHVRRSLPTAGPPDPPSLLRSLSEVEDLNSLRRGINRFLAAIYGDTHYLSDILREVGLKQGQIAHLQRECLSLFVTHVSGGWCHWLRQVLREPQYHLLVSLYGLNGKLPLSILEISEDWCLPETRCWEMWQEAIRQIRCAAGKPIEQIVLAVAKALLHRWEGSLE